MQIFIQDFYRELLARSTMFPSNLAYAAPRMVEQDWLGSYNEFDGVKLAIDRVSTRLSRNGHLLRDTIIDLEQNYAELHQGFLDFFPELQNFVTGQRTELLCL